MTKAILIFTTILGLTACSSDNKKMTDSEAVASFDKHLAESYSETKKWSGAAEFKASERFCNFSKKDVNKTSSASSPYKGSVNIYGRIEAKDGSSLPEVALITAVFWHNGKTWKCNDGDSVGQYKASVGSEHRVDDPCTLVKKFCKEQ